MPIFHGRKNIFFQEQRSITKVFTTEVRYVVVEPIEEHIRAFKQNISETPGMENVEFQFHCQTFEEFMEQRGLKEGFYLITAIHVMHYADIKIWMRCFDEILQEKGKILIFLAISGKSHLYIYLYNLSVTNLK